MSAELGHGQRKSLTAEGFAPLSTRTLIALNVIIMRKVLPSGVAWSMSITPFERGLVRPEKSWDRAKVEV